MQEQNFEKQVQQKMEELSFVPTEPVWQKVEDQIRHKKDRRRHIFWLLPLALLGSGYFLWFVNNDQLVENKSSASINISSEQKNNTLSTATTNQENNSQSHLKPSFKQDEKEPGMNEERKIVLEPFTNSQIGEEKIITSQVEKKRIKQRGPAANKSVIAKSNTVGKPSTEKETVEIATSSNETGPSLSKQPAEVATATPSKEDTSSFVLKDSTIILESPASDEDSVAQSQEPKVVQAARIKKTWTFSVRASIAISSNSDDLNMFKSIIGSQDKSFADLFSGPVYTPPTGANFNNAAPIVLPPSPVYNSLAYSAGLDLRRAFGKRVDVVSGINYQYFSTMHYVGRKVDNRSAMQNQFGNTRIRQEFYLNNSAAQSKYRTNYHFIAIPLSIDYLLLRKKPLHIEAGIQVAQLLSTNALYYDRAGGVYYEKKGLLRSTQFFGTTGFNYRILSGRGGSFYVGPQVQFGWTNLLAKKEHGQQHLLSAGVNTRFSF